MAGTTTSPSGSQAMTITSRPTPTDAANRLFCVLVPSRIADGMVAAITAATTCTPLEPPSRRASSDAPATATTNAASCTNPSRRLVSASRCRCSMLNSCSGASSSCAVACVA